MESQFGGMGMVRCDLSIIMNTGLLLYRIFFNKMLTVDNSKFNNKHYYPGRGFFPRALWYFINALILNSYFFPFYSPKAWLLKVFGAKVGQKLVIKPKVNIKYPWFLEVGENVWIGEGVWIDNLTNVKIGNNVCLSQGAFILTGNHNYSLQSFDLLVSKVILEDGVWIGANSTVCPGVICALNSVLTVGSVATSNLESFGVYTGVPATRSHVRKIS